MTTKEYERLALSFFKRSKEYNFVNLSFGLTAAVGSLAYALTNANKYYDLSFSDKGVGDAQTRLDCSVVSEVANHLSNVLWFTTVFARYLGFSLDNLMHKSIENKTLEQMLDEVTSPRV